MADANLVEALERINEIHGHLAKGEIYRGFRPLPIAIAGCGGLLAAWMQPMWVNAGDAQAFVYYWMAAAACCAVLAGPLLPFQIWRQNAFDRRRTLRVWGQFAPCLAAGGFVGMAIAKALPEAVGLLPGLWSVIFGLGVFSSRPFLPRATGWIALYYLMAGTWMMLHPQSDSSPAWPLAITFAVGQMVGGIVLYINRERDNG